MRSLPSRLCNPKMKVRLVSKKYLAARLLTRIALTAFLISVWKIESCHIFFSFSCSLTWTPRVTFALIASRRFRLQSPSQLFFALSEFMASYQSLYEEKCRAYEELSAENAELRAEIAKLRAFTSIAVSFVCMCALFWCNIAFRTRRRRKNMAYIAFGRRTRRSNMPNKRMKALAVSARTSTRRSAISTRSKKRSKRRPKTTTKKRWRRRQRRSHVLRELLLSKILGTKLLLNIITCTSFVDVASIFLYIRASSTSSSSMRSKRRWRSVQIVSSWSNSGIT